MAVAAQVNISTDRVRGKNVKIVGKSNPTSTTEETSAVYARIDRPAGIVRFGRPKDAAVMLDDWNGQVVDLISLIDDTCHLIHREVIAHRVVSDETIPEDDTAML